MKTLKVFLPLVILIIAAMSACSNHTDKDSQKSQAEAQETSAEVNGVGEDERKSVEGEVLQRVAEIYSLVEAAYRSTADMGPDVDIDKEFCTRSWCELRDKVLEKQTRTGYLYLDADYWVMGQDVDKFYADGFEFERFDEKNEKAYVRLKLHNMGSEVPVEVSLIREGGDWRIDNFKDLKYDIDFRAMMEECLTEN
ncbi:MAG: DUF3828 domain-containing protein [Muribaculaceae bacterium]|nr:DUF3828 domain-containing protein [Muribaculaceae bacterium]